MTHLLTRSEVEARCALSKTSIYRLMRTGTFPEPVVVGTRAVRWNEDEIAEWLASRPRSHGDGIHRATRRHRDAAR